MVYTTRRSSHWDWLVMNSWPSVDSMTSVSFARAVSLPRCPTCPVRRIAIVTTDGVSAKKPDWAGRRLFSILLFFCLPFNDYFSFTWLVLFVCLFALARYLLRDSKKKNKIKKETHWATKGEKKSLILRLYLSLSVCVSLSVRELVIDRSPPRAHPSKLGTLH